MKADVGIGLNAGPAIPAINYAVASTHQQQTTLRAVALGIEVAMRRVNNRAGGHPFGVTRESNRIRYSMATGG